MPKATVTLRHKQPYGGNQIGVYIEYNTELNVEVKKLNGVSWSASKRCWHVPAVQFSLNDFFNKFKPVAYINYSSNKILKSLLMILKYKQQNLNIPNKYWRVCSENQYI